MLCKKCQKEIIPPPFVLKEQDFLGKKVEEGSFCSNECLSNHIKDSVNK